MIKIDALFIGQPQTIHDETGTWRSAIYRHPVEDPIELTERGLIGDRVADTKHHGTPDQAVCCHPLDHYTYWNKVYDLTDPATMLGPGSVGENWTLSGGDERTTCIGDVYRVGTAIVQVSGPRMPCSKQERKLKLSGFLRRTRESLRTGFYVRVLTPGTVHMGDHWQLEDRPQPDLTQHLINVCAYQNFDPVLAERLLSVPELGAGWKNFFGAKLAAATR